MERNEHLEFCKICIHRKMNFKIGLTCGLTNEIADFDDSCPNFEIDEKEKERILREITLNKGVLAEIAASEDPNARINIAKVVIYCLLALASFLLLIYELISP